MYFFKLGFLGASVLLGCWALARATPARIGQPAKAKTNVVAAQERLFFPIGLGGQCPSSSGKSGMCTTYHDCIKNGSVPDGKCGFLWSGDCCLTQEAAYNYTCGGKASSQQSWFLNRNYPNTETSASGVCSFTVAAGSNVCQLRLDFLEFTVAQPNNEGVCVTDYLSVAGVSPAVSKICGANTGQHIYVSVTPGSNAMLDMIAQSVGEKWKIKVTQIPCDSADIAPVGCLQYYNGTSGTVTSFNYMASASPGTRQLADQSYGICVKPLSGYCSVTYRQAAGSSFSVSGDPSSFPPTLTPPPSIGTDCTTDYLLIPGATIVDTSGFAAPAPTTADRFCGSSFPGATSSARPYHLNFISNGDEASGGDSDNKGFMLTYTQNACRR